MDENKNTHDLFGLSDIGRIQDEIDRDLAEPLVPADMPDCEDSSAIADFPDTDEQDSLMSGDESFPTPDNMLSDSKKLSTFDNGFFYRETIKEAPPKKSLLKVAVLVLTICTLGTGSLGFGVGAGWGFVRERANITAGPERYGSGQTLTSATYIFETPENVVGVGTVTDIVELIVPSVVGITVVREDAPDSIGSGIIYYQNERYIFISTNLYVVVYGSSFWVGIAGRPPVEAFPVAYNPALDLAVLSIEKTDLIAAGIDSFAIASFGSSAAMRFGDPVFALGNAMGEGISMSSGIISAPQRYISFPRLRYPLLTLRTDAAINEGSSGGPLINTRGEIIGININRATALTFGQSLVEGMGYSIAADAVFPILMAIAEAGPTPGIGISGRTMNEYHAQRLSVLPLGVLVEIVAESRNAYNAGMQVDDVITTVNDIPIFYMEQLQRVIRAMNIGDIAEFRVIRNSNPIVLEVEIGLLQVRFSHGN